MVDATINNWGLIDALVNSAGHDLQAPMLNLTAKERHKEMKVPFLFTAGEQAR